MVFLLLLKFKGTVDHTHYVSAVLEHLCTKIDLLQHTTFKINLDRLWQFYMFRGILI